MLSHVQFGVDIFSNSYLGTKTKFGMTLFRYLPPNHQHVDPDIDQKIFKHSLLFPAVWCFLLILAEIIEHASGISFVKWGIYPRTADGLKGIVFAPFIHADFDHLISNIVPFFLLLFMLIYFYRRISYRIFFLLYILSGFFVWLVAREAWHIGASGIVYALAAFHLTSGIIRNDVRLLTLSVVVIFLYGGLMWGLFPIDPKISWEGHQWGAITGAILALYYRKYTIKRIPFDWELEPDDENEESEEKADDSIENPTENTPNKQQGMYVANPFSSESSDTLKR